MPDFRGLDKRARPRPISEKGLSAGGWPAQALFSDDGNTLIYRGVLVDKIEDWCYGPYNEAIQRVDM